MKTDHKPRRGIGFAVIAFTLVSVPTVSMARTDQQSPQSHVATTYPKKHVATRHRHPYARRNLYGWDQRPARGGCTYQNQFPPCQSTWPQGSPSYHGPIPGPTFFDEQ